MPSIPTTTASQNTLSLYLPPSLHRWLRGDGWRTVAAVSLHTGCCLATQLVLGSRQHPKLNLENSRWSLMWYQAGWYMLKWAHRWCLTFVSASSSWQRRQYNTVPLDANRGNDAVGLTSLFYHSNTTITYWLQLFESHQEQLPLTLLWCIENVTAGSKNTVIQCCWKWWLRLPWRPPVESLNNTV